MFGILAAVQASTLMIALCVILFLADLFVLCSIIAAAKKGKNQKKESAPVASAQKAKDDVVVANDCFDEPAKEEPVEETKEEPVEEVKTEEEPVVEAEEKPVEEEKPEEVKEDVEEVKAEEVEEEPVEEKAEEAKEEPVGEKTEEAPVEEEKATEEKKEEPVEETKEEPEMKKEKVDESKKKAPKEDKKADKKEKKAPAAKPVKKETKPEEKKEVAAAVEPVKAEVKESKNDKKILGKMEICNSEIGGFIYILRANNGQLLYESKNYKNYDSCENAANGFVEAVKVGMFSVRADKFKRYKFILKSPTSNSLIYVGESFDNERSCQSNIESVRRFAVDCVFVDSTSADFKATFKPYVISDDVKAKVANPNGIVGKWAIEQTEEGNKRSPYVFLLYANNNQLLYESNDYKSYSSCKSGLETFRKAVQEGEFIIDPDKSGRFKFILRNTSNKSLMEYIGQSYATQRACADGIDSIYRFALVSPIDKL